MKKTILFLLVFMNTGLVSIAQDNKEIAHEKGMEAIKLMEEGEIDKSLKLLKEAADLDPDNINYPYETAIAHYMDKDYKKSIKITKGLLDHKDINPLVYQILGNSYSLSGDKEKAISTYESGLEKFPDSGRLFVERGNIDLNAEEYVSALSFYEKGIHAEPGYPSNYYWASKIYLNSTEQVWGMIYGELFINLERNSKRTAEISEMLFNTYKNQISFTSDTSISVSFSKMNMIDINSLNDEGGIKMPFGTGVYEIQLMMSLIGEEKIDINSLNDIRTRFLNNYFESGKNKEYPNILFDYQMKIKDAGHLEAYNYWAMMKGDQEGFEEWFNANESKWESFVSWFIENQIEIDKNNFFHSSNYN